MSDAFFKNKKLNRQKLLTFGFAESCGTYTYATNIADDQLQMTVTVSNSGAVYAKIIDSASMEEYVLHRIPGACGAFVGMVKVGYENILRQISETCFEPDVFKSDYAQQIIQYARDTYHDDLEFLWQRFPGNAVLRRKDTGKWYGALLVLPKRKLGLDSDEVIDILDLRVKAEEIETVVDCKRYFPGYHMNKKRWVTICLDGSVPIDEIFGRIDASYALSVK